MVDTVQSIQLPCPDLHLDPSFPSLPAIKYVVAVSLMDKEAQCLNIQRASESPAREKAQLLNKHVSTTLKYLKTLTKCRRLAVQQI